MSTYVHSAPAFTVHVHAFAICCVFAAADEQRNRNCFCKRIIIPKRSSNWFCNSTKKNPKSAFPMKNLIPQSLHSIRKGSAEMAY